MFQEYYIYNISPNLTAGAGSVFEDTNLLIEDYDFIFKRTIHVATDNRINVKLYNPKTARTLFKGSDDIRHISGTSLSGITSYGFVPFNWPVPYRIEGKTRFRVSLADASSGGNQLYLAFHGDNVIPVAPLDMYGEPVDYNKDRTGRIKIVPVVYESPAITPGTGVGAEATQIISTDDNADFVCTRITGISTGTGFVTIIDQKRREHWQNQKTHVQTLFGNGQFPNNLTSPRFIQKKSSIAITFENLAGGANTLYLYLHGYHRGGN